MCKVENEDSNDGVSQYWKDFHGYYKTQRNWEREVEDCTED